MTTKKDIPAVLPPFGDACRTLERLASLLESGGASYGIAKDNGTVYANAVRAILAAADLRPLSGDQREAVVVVDDRLKHYGLPTYTALRAVAGPTTDAKPVLRIKKNGPYIETEPTQEAFELASGEYELFTRPPAALPALLPIEFLMTDELSLNELCPLEVLHGTALKDRTDLEACQQRMLDYSLDVRRNKVNLLWLMWQAERADERPSDWRPIATAPRDGTTILVRFGEDGVSQARHYGRTDVVAPWEFIDTQSGAMFVNYAVDGDGGPSHWMPMPGVEA
jgi:hypothetical protein